MDITENDKPLHVILLEEGKKIDYKLGDSDLGLSGAIEKAQEAGWKPIEEMPSSVVVYGKFGPHEILNPTPLWKSEDEQQVMLHQFSGSWYAIPYIECRLPTLEGIAKDYGNELARSKDHGRMGHSFSAFVWGEENKVRVKIHMKPLDRTKRHDYTIQRDEMLKFNFYGGIGQTMDYTAQYLRELGFTVGPTIGTCTPPGE